AEQPQLARDRVAEGAHASAALEVLPELVVGDPEPGLEEVAVVLWLVVDGGRRAGRRRRRRLHHQPDLVPEHRVALERVLVTALQEDGRRGRLGVGGEAELGEVAGVVVLGRPDHRAGPHVGAAGRVDPELLVEWTVRRAAPVVAVARPAGRPGG